MDPATPENSPLWPIRKELEARVGEVKTRLMLSGMQLNICLNLQLGSMVVPIVRQIHPISVNETSLEVYCLGALGESAEQRSVRLRQFEDFFSATGLASPDDSVIYEDVQRGVLANAVPVDGFSRGLALMGDGPNE